ncbi:hypothetical protein EC988_006907 [Linderina pennispora]|nr:hypothetical protein EC988_006907 [Linderina pennispora]
MSTGDMTEMVGVSGLIDEHAEEEYEQVATQILQSENPPRALALCGTFPPGLQSTTVSRIIQARTEKTLVFVDAVKDIHPVLESKCIDILKVNSGEVLNILSALEPAYQDKTPKDVDLAKVAMELGQRYSIGAVAVTDGPFTAYLANVQDNKAHAFSIPDLLKDREYFLGSDQAPQGHLVLNPLGAGDTCSAVMMNHMLDDKVMVEAFAAGLAAASASCLVPMPNCVFDRKVMERIRGKMTVREIM